MIIAGIDPGKTGALVTLVANADYPIGCVRVYRVPLMKTPKEVPAWGEWAQIWSAALSYADLIVIEQVAARPTQGVTSMFNFGQSLGFAKGLAHASGAAIHYVTPSKWKPLMGLGGADKNASREMARRLLPAISSEVERVKDDGVAEAALLALYGRKYL